VTGALDQLALFGEQGDAAARAAIATELGATLFVEAGAGTGKTAALVGRVVALVAGDGGDERVPMRAIAAITFTEKAAAELRDRIRAELVQRAGDPDAEPAARDAARAALDELDASAICTLHAFAQRLLTEFPVEAGLPPRIVVRDEISSRVAFETRWRDTLDEMLDDAALEVPVLVMLAAGIRLEHLRAVAEVLDDNWDLLDRIADVPAVPALDLDGWLTELDAVCSAADTCRVEGDTLVARLLELAEYGERIRGAFDDIERIRMLRAAKPSFRARGCGRKGNWPDVDAVRDAIARLGEARESLVRPVLDAAIRSVVVALAGSTERAVAARRVAGELEFHDLLVLARTLLRDEQHGPRVRRVLRARYRRILVDEFQDTDPIQVELAALLGSGSDGDGTRPWTEMHVDPGRLFFVGDPKQSIYRFRRADIATFSSASDTSLWSLQWQCAAAPRGTCSVATHLR